MSQAERFNPLTNCVITPNSVPAAAAIEQLRRKGHAAQNSERAFTLPVRANESLRQPRLQGPREPARVQSLSARARPSIDRVWFCSVGHWKTKIKRDITLDFAN